METCPVSFLGVPMNPYKPKPIFSMPRGANLEKLREIDRKRQAHYAAQKGALAVEAAPVLARVKATTLAPVPTRPTEETPEQRAAVEIPADWRELPWPRLRSLASKVCDDPISNRPVAVAAIEAELSRRNSK
jgi:hypothetical protein